MSLFVRSEKTFIEASEINKKQLKLAVFGLVVGLFLAGLDGSIVAVAMPMIAGTLGGFSRLAWVSTAYLVTTAMATPLLGKLSDIFGRRRIYLISVNIFLATSLLCGLAQNIEQLILFRALQGIGGGGIGAITFAIIAELVAPRERGRYIGLFVSVYAVSGVAGPLLGGWMVERLSWRWIFFVNLPIGFVALAIIASVLNINFHTIKAKVDVLGAIYLSLTIFSLFMALELGRTNGWASTEVVSLFVLTVVLLALFVRQEERVDEPMVPLRLLKDRVVRVCSVIAFFAGTTMFGASLYFSIFFQDVLFNTPTLAGLRTLPIIVGFLLSSMVVGRAISRTGKYVTYPKVGAAVVVIGVSVSAFALTPTSPFAILAVSMLLIGLGMGALMPTISIASQNAVEIRDLGVTTALVTFFRTLGGAVALALYSTIFNSVVADRLAAKLPNSASASTDLLKMIGTPKAIEASAPAIRDAITSSITDGIVVVFWIAIPVAAVALLMSFRLPARELRKTVLATPVAE